MLSPFLGIKFAGKATPAFADLEQGATNTKMTLGVSVAILTDNIFGIEGELGHTPRFFEQSGASDLIAHSNVTTLMGNVILAVPRRITKDSLRPYAVAGVGLIRTSIKDLSDLLPVRENLVGLSLGGGAIGRLTNRTSIRIDVRHIRNIKEHNPETGPGLAPLTGLSFWRATVGVALMGNLF
jgi:outer membrane protein with beta-barrel domain